MLSSRGHTHTLVSQTTATIATKFCQFLQVMKHFMSIAKTITVKLKGRTRPKAVKDGFGMAV